VQVKNLIPINGADLIELADINGWKCVVKKNDFNVGDMGVYITIDSVPDFEDPNFAFLKGKTACIKTMKMKGIISQGLLGPLSWLTSRGHDVSEVALNEDVTEKMGVSKYITEEEAYQYPEKGGNHQIYPKQPFPLNVPRTDATRLQNEPDYLTEIVDKELIITRKEDGCSATYVFTDGQFIVCGRNVAPHKSDPSGKHYFEIEKVFDIEKKMTEYGRNIAIQGEIIGPKINGNRLKLNKNTYRVFDIYDIDKQEYLHYDEITTICNNFQLEQVPLIYRGPANNLELTIEAFEKLATEQLYLKDVLAEGIVVKTDNYSPRTVFKYVSPLFLAKLKA